MSARNKLDERHKVCKKTVSRKEGKTFSIPTLEDIWKFQCSKQDRRFCTWISQVRRLLTWKGSNYFMERKSLISQRKGVNESVRWASSIFKVSYMVVFYKGGRRGEVEKDCMANIEYIKCIIYYFLYAWNVGKWHQFCLFIWQQVFFEISTVFPEFQKTFACIISFWFLKKMSLFELFCLKITL